MMAEIRDLGRMPGKLKAPVGKAQLAEAQLAQRLDHATQRKQLSESQLAELTELRKQTPMLKLMADIKALGRLPQERKEPCAERTLAQQLRRAKLRRDLQRKRDGGTAADEAAVSCPPPPPHPVLLL